MKGCRAFKKARPAIMQWRACCSYWKKSRFGQILRIFAIHLFVHIKIHKADQMFTK